MVPEDIREFFAACAGVAGALIGLLFGRPGGRRGPGGAGRYGEGE